VHRVRALCRFDFHDDGLLDDEIGAMPTYDNVTITDGERAVRS